MPRPSRCLGFVARATALAPALSLALAFATSPLVAQHACVQPRDSAHLVPAAVGQPATVVVVTVASDAAAGRTRAWIADTAAGRCIGYVEPAIGAPTRWLGFAPRPAFTRVPLSNGGDGSVAGRDAAVLALAALPAWTPTAAQFAAAASRTSSVAPAIGDASSAAASGAGVPADAVGRRYVANFRKYADHHWAKEGPNWLGNYYDRAWIYYQAWRRLGDPVLRERADLQAVEYRRAYLEKNSYRASAHWAQLEGVAEHYRVTGDTMSRVAVLKTANVLNYANAERVPRYQTAAAGESRISARTLLSAVLAWQVAPAAEKAAWAKRVDARLAEQFAWQRPDGSFPSEYHVCGGQLNYMVAMLNDALVKSYERYRKDPKIVEVVRRSADYLWESQWDPSARAFRYASVTCPKNRMGMSVGGPRPAADLNLMFVSTFGWLYRATGDATYRDRAEQIFASGVEKAYLAGSKQFNEAYTTSWRYLDYR